MAFSYLLVFSGLLLNRKFFTLFGLSCPFKAFSRLLYVFLLLSGIFWHLNDLLLQRIVPILQRLRLFVFVYRHGSIKLLFREKEHFPRWHGAYKKMPIKRVVITIPREEASNNFRKSAV